MVKIGGSQQMCSTKYMGVIVFFCENQKGKWSVKIGDSWWLRSTKSTGVQTGMLYQKGRNFRFEETGQTSVQKYDPPS